MSEWNRSAYVEEWVDATYGRVGRRRRRRVRDVLRDWIPFVALGVIVLGFWAAVLTSIYVWLG